MVASLCEKSTSAVTCAFTFWRPTTGSRMSRMRRMYCCSICCTYCSCWPSPAPAPPVAPSPVCDSSLPLSSTTLTAEGASSGTLEATRCTMPAIWLRSSVRPGCSVSSTEAEGFCCSRKKPFWFGSARCTRALCTEARPWIERVSSPSRPRWKLSFSWNWVMPKRLFSISSKPATEPLGRPSEARRRRTSCTLSAGTITAPPPSVYL